MKKTSLPIYYKLAKLSLESLLSNRVRALLTMLGIVIGAATIILVVSMGEGAKQDIDQQFSNMSVTTILINAPSSANGQKSKLNPNDVEYIQQLESVMLAAPQLTGKVTVTSNDASESFNVIGSFTDIFPIINADLIYGDFFTDEDEYSHEKTAVLGANVVEELFGANDADVIGEEINLGKKTFTIVGTLKYKGGSSGPTAIDDSIFTPYSSSYRYVLGKKGKFNINAMAIDVNNIDIAMDEIASILRKNHNIKLGGIDDFRIKDMGTNVQAAKESAQTMSLLLGSVGLVVLVVGGIGIMNIMYVTVSERTKEIGLRKAIGAKDKHIELQFLLEAIILSAVGYLVGAIVATGMFFLLTKLQISMVLIWWSYLLSLFFVMATGIFFGFAPAKKAAAMNPIDALRHE